MNNDTRMLLGCGCPLTIVFVVLWCVLVYAGYHAAAWVFG